MGFFSNLFGKKQDQPIEPARPDRSEDETLGRDWQDAGGSGVPQELAASEVLVLFESDESPVFVDVREPHECTANGSIPGAVHIPTEEMPSRLGELDPEKPVILYCASGMRSMDVGSFLLEKGFRDVSNLNGGFQNWTGPIDRAGKEAS